ERQAPREDRFGAARVSLLELPQAIEGHPVRVARGRLGWMAQGVAGVPADLVGIGRVGVEALDREPVRRDRRAAVSQTILALAEREVRGRQRAVRLRGLRVDDGAQVLERAVGLTERLELAGGAQTRLRFGERGLVDAPIAGRGEERAPRGEARR